MQNTIQVNAWHQNFQEEEGRHVTLATLTTSVGVSSACLWVAGRCLSAVSCKNAACRTSMLLGGAHLPRRLATWWHRAVGSHRCTTHNAQLHMDGSYRFFFSTEQIDVLLVVASGDFNVVVELKDKQWSGTNTIRSHILLSKPNGK